jgi:hypothetical protein
MKIKFKDEEEVIEISEEKETKDEDLVTVELTVDEVEMLRSILSKGNDLLALLTKTQDEKDPDEELEDEEDPDEEEETKDKKVKDSKKKGFEEVAKKPKAIVSDTELEDSDKRQEEIANAFTKRFERK